MGSAIRKPILLAAVAAAALLALPASGLAEKFDTVVTAHTDNDGFDIYGAVHSDEIACEKRREVRLYGPPFNPKQRRRGQEFVRYDTDITNQFGEYRFPIAFKQARQRGDLEFFVRALRADYPSNLCRFADSNVVSIVFD